MRFEQGVSAKQEGAKAGQQQDDADNDHECRQAAVALCGGGAEGGGGGGGGVSMLLMMRDPRIVARISVIAARINRNRAQHDQ